MTTKQFGDSIGSPFGPKWSYKIDIVIITKSLSSINQEKFDSDDSYKKFFQKLQKEIRDAELTYSWDTLTR